VLLHPRAAPASPTTRAEPKSKYEIWWTFGWPYETSAAMQRLVFSALFDRLPDIRIVAHHLGAMIPYFEGRVGYGLDQFGARTADEDYEGLRRSMPKRPIEYFRKFWADTAVFGSRAATVCGLSFFGAGPGRLRFRRAVRSRRAADVHPRDDPRHRQPRHQRRRAPRHLPGKRRAPVQSHVLRSA
jgi:hypothetical protein